MAGDRGVNWLLRGALVGDGRVVPDGWALIEGGVFSAVGEGAAPDADRVIEGAVLAPGFVDMHCHGGAGHAFDDGEDAIVEAAAFHRRHGTTRTMVSLVSASLSDLERRIDAARAVAARDDRVLGVHLEGPFLSELRKGAHDASLLVDPADTAISRVLRAVHGMLAMVTLAPERDGALEAIAALQAAGVVVAVGHTDASVEQGVVALDAGASVVTHAFNGMRGLDHRAPGVLPAAFDSDPTIEIIADGVHVHPRMVRLVFESAPGRVALITDAMAATGQPDGRWRLGSLDVEVTGGVPRLVEGGSIAGSTLTLDRAVRWAVGAGIPLVTAVDAATRVPAAALGVADRYGTIAVGRAADAVILDDALELVDVFSRGDRVAR